MIENAGHQFSGGRVVSTTRSDAVALDDRFQGLAAWCTPPAARMRHRTTRTGEPACPSTPADAPHPPVTHPTSTIPWNHSSSVKHVNPPCEACALWKTHSLAQEGSPVHQTNNPIPPGTTSPDITHSARSRRLISVPRPLVRNQHEQWRRRQDRRRRATRHHHRPSTTHHHGWHLVWLCASGSATPCRDAVSPTVRRSPMRPPTHIHRSTPTPLNGHW